MENINLNISDILMMVAFAYPPLLFFLPANVANKISFGVKVVKIIADSLEKAQNTKGGLTSQIDNKVEKTFIQKPR